MLGRQEDNITSWNGSQKWEVDGTGSGSCPAGCGISEDESSCSI